MFVSLSGHPKGLFYEEARRGKTQFTLAFPNILFEKAPALVLLKPKGPTDQASVRLAFLHSHIVRKWTVMTDTERHGKDQILTAMQSFVAELAVNSSVIRNQGAGGLIATARDFFKKIDLSAIPEDSADFSNWLGAKTADLMAKFPANASYFGTARKALNIFLRDAVYNTALNHAFRLDGPYPYMEAPIDSYAAKHLRALCGDSVPRVWPGLKHLTATEHDQYQRAAIRIAEKLGVHPADLDVFFYRA